MTEALSNADLQSAATAKRAERAKAPTLHSLSSCARCEAWAANSWLRRCGFTTRNARLVGGRTQNRRLNRATQGRTERHESCARLPEGDEGKEHTACRPDLRLVAAGRFYHLRL